MKTAVVIPCHNAADFVGQTIGSLLEQTRPAEEIHVILDRCSDGSLDVVRQFGDQVRLHAVDFGNAAQTRNFGETQCSGDAIMFLDADDVVSPDALAGLEAALTSEPEAVAIIPWQRLELVADRWVERPASTPSQRIGHDLLSNWLTGHYYPPCCVLWSRAAYERTGGWSEEFCINEDGDLAMRAMILGSPFVFATSGQAYYRRVPRLESLSGQRFSRAGLSGRLRVIEKLAAWLEERGRLDKYRRPLRLAFGQICHDCRGQQAEDLEARGHALARRYAAVSPTQRIQAAIRALKRCASYPKQAAAGGTGVADSEPLVSFGAAAAAAAARGQWASTDAAVGQLAVPAAMPTVSVIVPTYNRATLACRAIRSVLGQTYRDFEVLLVDDASTDDTESMVQALGDARIRYLRQPENRDVSAARNRGMRAARGQFIAFLDSDDEWLPDKLEQQLEVMRKAPPCVGLVYTGAVRRHDDGSECIRLPKHRGDVLAELLLFNITDAGSASVLMRRNVVRVVGFFDEGIPAMEDYDYWIRVARFYHFDFVNQPLVRYYEVQRDDRRSLLCDSDVRARQRLFDKFRSDLNRNGLAHRFLLISAKRRMTSDALADRLGALTLVLRAMTLSPADPQSYRLLYRIFFKQTLPHSLLGRLIGSGGRSPHKR